MVEFVHAPYRVPASKTPAAPFSWQLGVAFPGAPASPYRHGTARTLTCPLRSVQSRRSAQIAGLEEWIPWCSCVRTEPTEPMATAFSSGKAGRKPIGARLRRAMDTWGSFFEGTFCLWLYAKENQTTATICCSAFLFSIFFGGGGSPKKTHPPGVYGATSFLLSGISGRVWSKLVLDTDLYTSMAPPCQGRR